MPHLSPGSEINSWSGCDRGRAGRTMYTGLYAKKSTRCGGSLSLPVHPRWMCASATAAPALFLFLFLLSSAAAAANLNPVLYLKDGGGGGEKSLSPYCGWGPLKRAGESAREREREEGGRGVGVDVGGGGGTFIKLGLTLNYNQSTSSRLPPHCRIRVRQCSLCRGLVGVCVCVRVRVRACVRVCVVLKQHLLEPFPASVWGKRVGGIERMYPYTGGHVSSLMLYMRILIDLLVLHSSKKHYYVVVCFSVENTVGCQ